jgi:hypothetical protein
VESKNNQSNGTARIENCDLCIVGMGAAGLNALYAASKYLTKNDKVIFVDKRSECGGMWTDTYDYVRLHQPHPTFTAGDIPWTLDKEPDHLASKSEVQVHLKHCLETLRKRVTLIEYYGYEYTDHEEIHADGRYHAELKFSSVSPGGEPIRVKTKRAVKAFGHWVPKSEALKVTSRKVGSLSPHDARLMEGQNGASQRPVYIVGGGKTAMDTAHELLTRFPGREVHLVVGAGTIFVNRNKLFSKGIKRWWAGIPSASVFSDIGLRFNGDNEHETLEHFRKNYCVQLDDSFTHHAYGVLSEEENEFISKHTASVIKDYLSDIIDENDVPTIVFRSGARQPVQPGSMIVNCTGYTLRRSQPYEPYLSKHGTVISVQMRSAIHALSTFGAYYLVHLSYLGKLDKLPLYEMDQVSLSERNRVLLPFACTAQVLLNTFLIMDAVPWRVIGECGLDNDRLYPLPRRLLGMFGMLRRKKRLLTQCKAALDRIKDRTSIRCGVLDSVEQRVIE